MNTSDTYLPKLLTGGLSLHRSMSREDEDVSQTSSNAGSAPSLQVGKQPQLRAMHDPESAPGFHPGSDNDDDILRKRHQAG